MITNAILTLLSNVFNWLTGLLPSFTFLDNLIIAKDNFITFVTPILEHTLYVFNIPVLSFSVRLLYVYIGFVVIEYSTKLYIKYITRVV